MRQSSNETLRRDNSSSELGITTAWNSRDVFLAQPGLFLSVSFPRPLGSGAKGCEQRSSALKVCTLKAAREVMSCGFDHLLVSSGASVCNLDSSRTLPQAETDPFVRLN